MRAAKLVPVLLAFGIMLFSDEIPAVAKGGGRQLAKQVRKVPSRPQTKAAPAPQRSQRAIRPGSATLSPMLVLDPFSSTFAVVGASPVKRSALGAKPPQAAVRAPQTRR